MKKVAYWRAQTIELRSLIRYVLRNGYSPAAFDRLALWMANTDPRRVAEIK